MEFCRGANIRLHADNVFAGAGCAAAWCTPWWPWSRLPSVSTRSGYFVWWARAACSSHSVGHVPRGYL
eukprot:g2749.t1